MMHHDEAHPGLASVLKDETTLQNALTDAGIPDAEMRIMYGGAADS